MSPTKFSKNCNAMSRSLSNVSGSRSSFANCSILSTMQLSCGPWLAGRSEGRAGRPKQALFKSGLLASSFA